MTRLLQSRRTVVARAVRVAICLAALVAAPVGRPPDASAAPSAVPAAHAYAVPVREAARRFGIPEIWIWRVMHAESRGHRRAVSPAGAMGLMQIMPATWSMLTSKHRLGRDPFDVRANIHAGAAYLRAMWDRYRDVRLMLAAYNAGPGRADAFASGRRGLPAETIAYVAAIAPELGMGSHVSPTLAVPAIAPSWRDADLFSGRREAPPRGRGAEALPSGHPSGDGPSTSTFAPNSLFVPISEKGR